MIWKETFMYNTPKNLNDFFFYYYVHTSNYVVYLMYMSLFEALFECN